MENCDGAMASGILQSDAKAFSASVEVNTAQLERYLCTIQETLAKHEDSFKLVPLLARKLDLCILDVDVIRDKFYQQEATGIDKFLQVGLTLAHYLSVNRAPYFYLHEKNKCANSSYLYISHLSLPIHLSISLNPTKTS